MVLHPGERAGVLVWQRGSVHNDLRLNFLNRTYLFILIWPTTLIKHVLYPGPSDPWKPVDKTPAGTSKQTLEWERRNLLGLIRTCSILILRSKRKRMDRGFSLICASFLGAIAWICPMQAEEPSLAQIQKILTRKKMVDLTHAFRAGYPAVAGVSG